MNWKFSLQQAIKKVYFFSPVVIRATRHFILAILKVVISKWEAACSLCRRSLPQCLALHRGGLSFSTEGQSGARDISSTLISGLESTSRAAWLALANTWGSNMSLILGKLLK